MADRPDRPMRFNEGPARTPQGQFAKLPDNPLTELEDGAKIREWAPGMGQSTAKTTGQNIPTPPVPVTKSVPSGLPFRNMRRR